MAIITLVMYMSGGNTGTERESGGWQGERAESGSGYPSRGDMEWRSKTEEEE